MDMKTSFIDKQGVHREFDIGWKTLLVTQNIKTGATRERIRIFIPKTRLSIKLPVAIVVAMIKIVKKHEAKEYMKWISSNQKRTKEHESKTEAIS